MQPNSALLATAFLLVNCLLTSKIQLVDSQNTCHLRELDLCAATLLVFVQSPSGLATSDNEINKQCGYLRDATGCMQNYTRKCMTPMQREMIFYAANSSRALLDEYCTKGSQLRTSYLKHAPCFNQLQKKELQHKSCLKDLQVSLELLSSSPKQLGKSSSGADVGASLAGKQLKVACCAYKRFESCLGGQMEKRCGKESVQFAQSVLRRATSRLPETLCRNYKPDGQECRALLPKGGGPNNAPKGPKSNSILSRLLSAYSGL